MKNLCAVVVLLLFLFISHFTFAQSSSHLPKMTIIGEEVQLVANELESSFAAYEVFQLDLTDLMVTAQQEEIFAVDFQLGKQHQWKVVFELNDLRADHFKETFSLKNPHQKNPPRRATTFKGFTNNPGSPGEEARFNISEKLFNGFVTVHGQEYFIEPLRMTLANGPSDYYVVYRPQDVLSDLQHVCSVEAVQRSNFQKKDIQNQGLAGKASMDFCWEVELVTASTYDLVEELGSTVAVNDFIAMIINLAEGIFVPFSLEYTIVEQFAPATADDDPFTSTVFGQFLLVEMETWAGPNMMEHDLGQLWTQRDMIYSSTQNIGGIANIDAVCDDDRYSVIENYSDNLNCLRGTTAHEFAHNFSAEHISDPGFLMTSPGSSCNTTIFNSTNTMAIEQRIINSSCLGSTECCRLEINCDQLSSLSVECIEDAEIDLSLIEIIESCGTGNVNIETSDESIGGSSLSVVRTYKVTDPGGNMAICEQVIHVYGSNISVTSIPGGCVDGAFTISGEYAVCTTDNATGVQLFIQHDDFDYEFTLDATLNGNGTWSFNSTLQDMLALGLDALDGHEITPILLVNGVAVAGSSYPGLFTDLYLATLSNPQVVINNNPDDGLNAYTFLCEGEDIYYHGIDPLSANHKVTIRRKPTFWPAWYPFIQPQSVGWLNASLDGYDGNLSNLHPNYLLDNFLYQLTIETVGDDPNCDVTPPLVTVFEVVDCCDPKVIITDLPECVSENENFTITVLLEAPLKAEAIEQISSSFGDMIYVDHQAVSHPYGLEVAITFTSVSCGCGGEALEFGIQLEGCADPLMVSTEPIPCCAMDCPFADIVAYSISPCLILNGMPARRFCIRIQSQEPLVDVFPGSNNMNCPIELFALETTLISPNGIYDVCGILQYTDPDCTWDVSITLAPEVADGCCSFTHTFSDLKDCPDDEACYAAEPDVQSVYAGNFASVSISLDVPFGDNVVVIDQVTGSTQNLTVQTINCGPFAVDQDGNVFGGTPCNGVVAHGQSGIDCRESAGEDLSYPYHFEIHWGNCIWVLIGDYCHELVLYPQEVKGLRKDSEEGLRDVFAHVYPNPVSLEGVLNIEVSEAEPELMSIQLRDIYGKVVENLPLQPGQKYFQHPLSASIGQGVYFLQFHFSDGRVKSKRLVMVE